MLAGGCASTTPDAEPRGPFEVVEQIFTDEKNQRQYVVLDNKRYISGPYGQEATVNKLIEEIKRSAKPKAISNRAVNLPNKPANLSLSHYQYQAPQECGDYRFSVYEGRELQILQFDYLNGTEITRIRDYTKGPTPFVSAGLWGPYDHTDDTAMEMCLLPGDGSKDGMGLVGGNYEIGWITNIVDWKQAELGKQYARAVENVTQCLQQLASLSPSAKQNPASSSYVIQAGDSLTGIAKKHYGKSSRWKTIYDANRDIIGDNPGKIVPGVTLTIP